MYERDLATEFPGPQRIVELTARGTERFGDRDMIVTPASRLTYREVDQASQALATSLLEAGAGKGTRIAVHLPHGPEWLVALFAITRIGALFMPFSAAYKPPELRKALALGDAQILLGPAEARHGGGYADFLAEALPGIGDEPASLCPSAAPYLRHVWLFNGKQLPPWARSIELEADEQAMNRRLLAAIESQVTPAGDAMVIWTSGTTSDPKGAVHTQGTVAGRAKANAHSHAFVLGDRIFCDFAFWWVGGLGYGLLPAYWVGATVLAVPKHDPEQTEAFLAAERPTRVAGRLDRDVASRVMAPGEGSSHLRTPPGIGMTETFGPHSMFDPQPVSESDGDHMGNYAGGSAWPDGLGPAILGFERKIIDPDTGKELPNGEPGELLVRGPGMMSGLYRRERDEVFDPDGWYHTGDQCWIEDGIIHLVSRLNEMIKTSGSNVAPAEVELVLYSLPGVQEPAVFGLPDPERGQQVVAVVVRSQSAELDADMVRDHVRSELSNYKVPRLVVILDDDQMPRLHSGKPDKASLKELVASRLASSEGAVAR